MVQFQRQRRAKRSTSGFLDGQFLRARPHDQQPFWGWFTPAISGYFWFVGRFMMVYGNASHPVAPAAGHLPGIRVLPPSAVISRPARRKTQGSSPIGRPKVTKVPVGLTSGLGQSYNLRLGNIPRSYLWKPGARTGQHPGFDSEMLKCRSWLARLGCVKYLKAESSR